MLLPLLPPLQLVVPAYLLPIRSPANSQTISCNSCWEPIQVILSRASSLVTAYISIYGMIIFFLTFRNFGMVYCAWTFLFCPLTGMGGDMGGAMGGAMGGGMGAPPGGGIGNVGGLDPQMFAQVVQNPMMRQMMQELAGNPEMMRALMRNNPMMNQMTAHNPGLRNLFESPDVLQGLSSMMSNPETMQRMSQMQAAFQSAPQAQADGAAPTGVQERSDTPATTGTAQVFFCR
eukprot:GHVT01082874.1.p2 GENE.GHVT01082874.1~~GHVT01082874.1.p2  ORF type:complete len:232 (+),score=15.36 GHVT01082874.1:3784-4479(+)